ncbi:MAG: HNH endonuclease [Flavobacteriales bacterium]|nr:HNH endonuclease [Flavobacteriales bacterium]
MAIRITPEQEAALVDFYEHGDLAMLCEDLGVERDQLHAMAAQLGLASRKRLGDSGKRVRWTPAMDDLIRLLYPEGDLDDLLDRLQCSERALRLRARSIGVRRPRKATTWTDEHDDYLRAHYATENAAAIAKQWGVNPCVVYRRAEVLGLKKSPTFLSDLAKRSGLAERGKLHGFKKGSVPANKGKKMPGHVRELVKHTWFRKGHRTWNGLPIGSTRVNADGYLDRKVQATGYPPDDWEGVHRLVWREAHGEIPPDHVVAFKNGKRTTVEAEITLDRLELVSRTEMMRRNTVHNLPPEMKEVVQALGLLKRTINYKTRKEHEQEA